MVFHTATAPNPCFKRRDAPACRNCSGGAEASQNGFRRTNARKVDTQIQPCAHQPFVNRMRGQLSVLHGPHGGSSTPRAECKFSPGVNARQNSFFEISRFHLDESFSVFSFSTGKRARVFSVVRWPFTTWFRSEKESRIPRTGLRRRTVQRPSAGP